jgi:pSer/pThr/pTyr-binding forkhead associated (FHA) protein
MSNVAGRVTLFVLAGLLAGLFTWFVTDGSGIIRLSDSVTTLSSREMTAYQIIFMVWGGSIGVLLGLADALASGTMAQWPRIVAVGLAVGIVAGVIGGAFGMAVFGPLYVVQPATPFAFLRNVLTRALGWAFIGALAGTASGWRKLSLRVGRNGLIGGLIGGILGGATFEIIPYLMPGIRPGPVSRLFGFLITGAMIGLFVALVSELLKEAWIKVVVGRNEGKEVLVEKQETRIGRAELSDIPLYGDPQIARTHAVVVALPSGGFVIRDVSETPVGVILNDRRVDGEAPLRTGDQIRIASRLLVFYERVTREPTAPERRDVAVPRAAAPASVAGAAGLPSLADLPGVSVSVPIPPLPRQPPVGTDGGGHGMGASAHLIAMSGPYTGTAFPARPGSVIGRDPDADIALPADSKASRSHARLVSDAAGLAIEDAGSTNGTFVNGQPVSRRQTLVPGDTVVIGATSFRVE